MMTNEEKNGRRCFCLERHVGSFVSRRVRLWSKCDVNHDLRSCFAPLLIREIKHLKT
jgi:hypothetical protein